MSARTIAKTHVATRCRYRNVRHLPTLHAAPARTFASALPAHVWSSAWIYFVAPPLGMLAAAEVYVRARGAAAVHCAKLHQHNTRRCIFRCGTMAAVARRHDD